MADWNPEQYLEFSNAQTQPAIDLASRIPPRKRPGKILDIGCGPGNSTHILAQKFPHACIIGIDSSESMIRIAKNASISVDARPDFMICDASTGLPGLETDYDIVFSNAAIQWIPRHEELLKNMMERLKPGGVMAVQVPHVEKHPLHRAIRSVINSEKYKGAFPKNLPQAHTLSAEAYAVILSNLSGTFDIWETTYYRAVTSYRDIVRWLAATRLHHHFQALSPGMVSAFEADLANAFTRVLPVMENGHILMPFPRLFFIALR